MSNTATVQDVVTRSSVESALRAAALPSKSRPSAFARRMGWIALLAASAMAIAPISQSAMVNLETWTLLYTDDVALRIQLANAGRASGSAEYFEALAELSVQPATQDLDAGRIAAQASVQADPSRAHAWALLAYLESQTAGKVTPAALEALTRSMKACPLCDQDLIRWRFNYVLANWNAVPDEIRREAFNQADILRWTGQNSEFLAEMRMKAAGAGIPFDDYRIAVDTPVRIWDVAPASEAAATALLRPKT